jgi:hypothetical protein
VKAIILPDHQLKHEGAGYLLTPQGLPVRINQWGGTGGLGRALCSCGVYSDDLPSGLRRKQWHRKHKAEVAGFTSSETTGEAK